MDFIPERKIRSRKLGLYIKGHLANLNHILRRKCRRFFLYKATVHTPSYDMPLCTVIPVFIRNVKVNPPFSLYFQGFPAFLDVLRAQIQTALLKTFFSLLPALLQSLVSLYFLPISTLYSCNSRNLQFSRTFPDRSDGFSDILFHFW